MNDLFVSWSGYDAQRIGDLIFSLFKPYETAFKVYLSSRTIAIGDQWNQNLSHNLAEASDGLVIFSQEALKSDWLLHESAVLSSKFSPNDPEFRGLTILRLGAPPEMLPKPLANFQHAPLTRDSVERWLDALINRKGLDIPLDRRDRFLDQIQSIALSYGSMHVSSEAGRWANAMGRPITISQQRDSPFDLGEILRIAQKRLILIAQNHAYMTLSPHRATVEGQIFDRLAAGVEIEVIAMHPHTQPMPSGRKTPWIANACAVWADYMHVGIFEDQLKACWDTLLRWRERADKEAFGDRLKIKGAFFLPQTLNFVDPDDSDGFIVLSPRLDEYAAGPRPQFIITRKYEGPVFNYYWNVHNTGYDAAGWAEIDVLPRPQEWDKLTADAYRQLTEQSKRSRPTSVSPQAK